LAWISARSSATIPIPDFKTAKQVEEYAVTMQNRPLSEAQVRQIDDLLGRTRGEVMNSR
jgi:aryl-alcohol dehydrogenase-like predicted oxidoreductase